MARDRVPTSANMVSHAFRLRARGLMTCNCCSQPVRFVSYSGGPMFNVPESACPKCGRVYRCQTPAHLTGLPKPGDLIVCIGCTDVLTFDPQMQLVKVGEARWRLL